MYEYRRIVIRVGPEHVRVRWVFDSYEERHYIFYEIKHRAWFCKWQVKEYGDFAHNIPAKSYWHKMVNKAIEYA